MKELRCPSRYRKFVLVRLEQALADIERDIGCRDDEVIKAFAPVPEKLIDQRRTGELLIVVGEVEEPRAKMERVS